MHKSSATVAVCGRRLLNHAPLWPACWNGKMRAGQRNGRLLRSHAGQALAAAHALRQLFAVEFVEQRLVVKQVDLGRRAGLEKVNDALGLGGKAGKTSASRRWLGRPSRRAAGGCRRAMAPRPRAVLAEEMAASDGQRIGAKCRYRIHKFSVSKRWRRDLGWPASQWSWPPNRRCQVSGRACCRPRKLIARAVGLLGENFLLLLPKRGSATFRVPSVRADARSAPEGKA
jgi:hypothetical protein